MKLLIIAAASLAVVSCASISLEDLEFHAWKLKFGRSYNSPAEEAQRRSTWMENRELVLVHNILADQGIKSYHMGMNHFADMTNQEYRDLVIGGGLKRTNSTKSGSTFLGLSLRDVPKEVDWRDKGFVTDVKDQKQCSSGWAFAATGSLEGQTFKKTGKLVSLSEQQLVDCSTRYGNVGCLGGFLDPSFKSIKHNGGIDTEASYPYEAKFGVCRFNPDSIGATCSGYVDITYTDENALQEAVATIGPVAVFMDASQASFQMYESGVYDEPQCSTGDLNHGVLAVGYGSEDGKDYWLVKNSWGLSWGDKGYIKMTRNKHNQCGIASSASYPLV